MKKPIKKPTKKKVPDRWEYRDVIKYLEQKYKFCSTDFAGKFKDTKKSSKEEIPYQNFWHWMLENDDSIHNGCMTGICIDDCLDATDEEIPVWVKTILGYFKAEFPKDSQYMELWVEW